MFCVRCGFENPEGSRFCARCGAAMAGDVGGVTGGPVGSGVVGDGEGYRSESEPELGVVSARLLPELPGWLRDVVRSGWESAWWGALAAAAVLFGVGLVFALLVRFAVGDAWDLFGSGVVSVAKLAGLVAFVLARVPIRFEGTFDLLVAQGGGTVVLVVSVLGGFVLMGWLLVSAGRRVAESSGARELRVLLVEGAKVGVPFAVILFVTSFVFSSSGDVLSYGPSHSGALGVGLLWGGVFGVVGGLRAARRTSLLGLVVESVPQRFRVWVSATQGAMRGVVTGFGLASVATVVLVGLVVVDNDVLGGDGLAAIGAVVLAAILLLPNAVTVGLLFAHGATLQAAAALTGSARYSGGMSLFDFPRGFGLSGDLAPWYVFLALVIPAIAVFGAGQAAAAYAKVRSSEEARRVGILVGVPYAVMLWVAAALARTTIHVSAGGYFFREGSSSGGQLGLGVALGGAFLLTLVWGSVGGMVGARYYLSRLPTAKRPPSGTHRVQPAPHADVDTTDTVGRIHCVECGASLPADSRFCFTCGADQT